MIRVLARHWDYIVITIILLALAIQSCRTGHHQELLGYAIGWPSAMLLMYALNRMVEKEREHNH